jgi:regulator of sirC expression with transglutaminase-like and TPR domain
MSDRQSSPPQTPPPDDIRPARTAALVHLLGDDDPKIASVAWEELERLGDFVLSAVEEAGERSEDHRVRTQTRRFLTEWSRREVFREWVEYCRSDARSLEKGAFLIARSEYPKIEVSQYEELLNEHAYEIRQKLRVVRTNGEAVRELSRFIFETVGYTGNEGSYYDPDNSYLNRVLDRRTGIPISLAVVFLLVARRLSIAVHGVSMPRHFLLKFREPRGDVFIDVFRGGQMMSTRECADFLQASGIPFQESHLKAVPPRKILRRMLGNLLRVYLRREDARRSRRLNAMLEVLGDPPAS